MKLIAPDYLIIVAMVMVLGVHLCTNFLIAHYQSAAESIGAAQDIAYEFEGNPVARWMFRVQGINLIYSYVVMPSMIAGFYYMIRRIYKTNPEMVMVFAISLVVMSISNFLNDFTILLGILSR